MILWGVYSASFVLSVLTYDDRSITVIPIDQGIVDGNQAFAYDVNTENIDDIFRESVVINGSLTGVLMELDVHGGRGQLIVDFTSFPVEYRSVPGRYTVSITYDGVTSNPFDVVVPGGPPKINGKTLIKGKVGQKYKDTLTASGTAPISWAIVDYQLPDGLELKQLDGNTASIEGIPTVAVSQNFTIRATNDYGRDSLSFNITYRSW